MAVPATVAFRPRQKKAEAKPVDDGFWSDLGHRTASGLQYAGETLNKISRATWGSANALAGGDAGGGLLNLIPFSDTMGLTDPSKGIELSGFLENRGLLPKNKPGLDWYDPVRLAADVGGDLTTYLGGLGLLRGLGKGGSVLSKASKLPAGLSRVGRMTTTVDDLAGKIAPEALGDAVRRSGFSDVSEFLAKHGSEPVGGLASLNKPFGSPVKALGTGPTAQKIGGALDKLGETVRYGKIPGTQISPGQQVARVFSSDAMGLHTPEVGKASAGLAGQRDLIEAGVKKNVARDAIHLMRNDALDDEASTLGRMYAEGVLDTKSLPAEAQAKARTVAQALEPYRQRFPELLQQSRKLGIRVEDFGDPAGISYWPREFVDMIQNHANNMPRQDYLRGVKEGTEELRKIIADPKVLEGTAEDARHYIQQNYKIVHPMPSALHNSAKYQQAARDAVHMMDQLVHRIRHVYTPEQRAVGGFGRNVLLDAQDATIGMEWKIARAGSMLETLKDFAKPIGQLDVPGDTRSVADVLEAAGLQGTTKVEETLAGAGHMGQKVEKRSGALHQLAEAFDMAPSPENLDAIAKMHVPAAIGDDLVRLLKGDDIKTAVDPWVQAMDSFTNLFKVGVLNWPARYVRDLTSGQAMNVITGNWSPDAFAAAQRLISGGVQDFTDIPIVQRMLAEQGLEATAENSTDVMRQLIYAHDVFTGMHGAQGAGEVVGGGAVPGLSADFAREFVGTDPISPLKPSTLVGGSSWNPLKLRGVGGEIRTENYLAATGERAGKYTDGLNRIVPFIHNLKRGMDPARAKEVVDALQINYAPSKFTAAERKYLKRAFPFYSFQKSIAQSVMKQLAERPGGGIAQTIRASNNMRDDDAGPVPESVSQGLSVPLGETSDGSSRYLTGMSLMHEAPAQLIAPTIGGTLSELASQAHPLAKFVAETATGRSMFQRRDLDELDPGIGRTLSNLGLREDMPSGRARPFISSTFENFMANTPATRFITTARTLTDPRKYEATGSLLDAFPGQAAAMNLLTGLRLTDVSPRVQRGILIDQLGEVMKAQGAQSMVTIRFKKADIEAMEKKDKKTADSMRQLNAAANTLLNEAKESAKIRRKK